MYGFDKVVIINNDSSVIKHHYLSILGNFEYELNFKDKNGVPISTVKTVFKGDIESKKAKRAFKSGFLKIY